MTTKEVLEIILKFLEIIFSWPVATLILFLFVIFRHREAIDYFIKNIKIVSPKGIETHSRAPREVPVPKEERETLRPETDTTQSKIALVECKVAHALPGTVIFDFLKDWKVWFWIANREPKRYRAYVKIKFIADRYEEEVSDGYYGGTTAWNLNAFSGIQAPGLGFPEKIKEAAKAREKIKIEINCTVKNENDELVEKKLPTVYAYEYESKFWYLEP